MGSMLTEEQQRILFQAKRKTGIQVRVHGTSMYPTLMDGEIVTAVKMPQYSKGDIVVFSYHKHSNRIHRIVGVDVTSGAYICKGDNAYDCEIIYERQIIGKVIKCQNSDLAEWPDALIQLSLNAAAAFRAVHCDVQAMVNVEEYRLYRHAFSEFTSRAVESNGVHQSNSHCQELLQPDL